MQRRTFMKAVGVAGAAGAAGVGLQSLTGTAAGASVNISAANAEVSNDRGTVSEVTINPYFNLSWDGFDDAVGKIFFLVEANVDGNGYEPLFRATPWLKSEDIGTSGSYTKERSGEIIVADENGRPDYSKFDFSSLSDVDIDTYLNGTSMQSADNYVAGEPAPDAGDNVVVPESEPLQNNHPDADAGYYGAASGVGLFSNPDDRIEDDNASKAATSVTLRYTFELQRPNLSQLKYRTANEAEDGETYYLEDGETTWKSLTDSEKKEYAAGQIDDLEVSDIDSGNSAIVMNGEDGYPNFDEYSDGTGIPYDVLQTSTNHPGIVVETAQFNVEVINQNAGASASGDSGTNVS